MAVVALVATVTFGASLSSLVSHPALYGWNWDYMLEAGGDLPGPKVTALLDHDPYVSAWSGIYAATLRLNGQEVPVLGETPGGGGGAPVAVGPRCPGRRPGGPGLPHAGPAARARGRHGRRRGSAGGPTAALACRGYGDLAGAGGQRGARSWRWGWAPCCPTSSSRRSTATASTPPSLGPRAPW